MQPDVQRYFGRIAIFGNGTVYYCFDNNLNTDNHNYNHHYTKTDAKTNTKPNTKTDTKTNTKPNTKTDTKANTKPNTKTDTKNPDTWTKQFERISLRRRSANDDDDDEADNETDHQDYVKKSNTCSNDKKTDAASYRCPGADQFGVASCAQCFHSRSALLRWYTGHISSR